MSDTPDPARRGGPRTEEGKARSARNALRHGLRAARFALLPEEDPEEFKALVAELRRVHAPTEPIELLQVDAIAVAIWRELRADRLEAEALADLPPAEPGRSCGSDLADPARRAGLATILRYRAQAQAEHRRALLLLEKHRRLRGPAPAARPAGPASGRADAAADFCTNGPGPALEVEPPEPARVAPRARARAELGLKERIRAYARGLADLEATGEERSPPGALREPPPIEEDPVASAQALLAEWLERNPALGPGLGPAPGRAA